jgi:hypothetical protein
MVFEPMVSWQDGPGGAVLCVLGLGWQQGWCGLYMLCCFAHLASPLPSGCLLLLLLSSLLVCWCLVLLARLRSIASWLYCADMLLLSGWSGLCAGVLPNVYLPGLAGKPLQPLRWSCTAVGCACEGKRALAEYSCLSTAV